MILSPPRCFRLQRYKFLKAIHNDQKLDVLLCPGCFRLQRYKFLKAIHNAKTNRNKVLFGCFRLQRYKFLKAIHNSWRWRNCYFEGCFRLQRYKFLKAIHNAFVDIVPIGCGCFRLQRYKFLKAIHNMNIRHLCSTRLFQTTKIQIFESNSQLYSGVYLYIKWLFQTTKIQIFESNSQQDNKCSCQTLCCFRLQRYKFLKAIHNHRPVRPEPGRVVSDYKDTNFWKQFTTWGMLSANIHSCFRLQRYKFLKAIHNSSCPSERNGSVVSDYKDTNFWKQFTTIDQTQKLMPELFQTTKIQIFESNSQH